MEAVGLRAITRYLLEGQYDPYEYCFDAPGMLVHESEDELIMSIEQYDRLFDSDLEDLCFDFEDDWDSAKTADERAALSKTFVERIKVIYETIMI